MLPFPKISALCFKKTAPDSKVSTKCNMCLWENISATRIFPVPCVFLATWLQITGLTVFVNTAFYLLRSNNDDWSAAVSQSGQHSSVSFQRVSSKALPIEDQHLPLANQLLPITAFTTMCRVIGTKEFHFLPRFIFLLCFTNTCIWDLLFLWARR
jgi:hypothetical protein